MIALFFTTGGNDNPEDDAEIIPASAITSLSEGYGRSGSILTISGIDFHSSAIVYFGDVATTPTSIEPTSIIVTVPDNAMGDISIIQGDVTTNGPSYHVYTPAKNLFFTDNDSLVSKIDLINAPKVSVPLFSRVNGISEGPNGIAVSDDGFLYVVIVGGDEIIKMAKDGSGNVEVLYDHDDGVYDSPAIAIDDSNDMLYWPNNGSSQIMKASTSGSGSPSVLKFDGNPAISYSVGLKLDFESCEFYLSDLDQYIKKGKMDGTGTPEVLYNPDNSQGMDSPNSVFIDPVRGKMYWTDGRGSQIVEANMDGTGTPIVLFDSNNGLKYPRTMVVDYGDGEIYWSDRDPNKIYRGNLDGTGAPEELVDADRSWSMVLEF